MDTYKKKYEDALERAKAMIKVADNQDEAIGFANTIFPELKESEDEKIRKAIHIYLDWLDGRNKDYQPKGDYSIKDMIAWLEKQGKEQPTIIWHSIDDKPEEMKELFCEWGADDATWHDVAFYDEESHTFRHAKMPIDVTKWVYVDELLEKQGEQKLIVEPKFKVGDWIVNKGHSYLIADIDYEQRRYLFEIGGYTHEQLNWEYIENADNKYHLWTIQDAKDGDVLSDGTAIFIFKDLLSDGSVMSYCDYDTDSGESDAFCPLLVNLMCSKITPATKERRDTLFAKIHEAGYIWDAKKKELKKIEQKSQRMISAEAKESMYDKPAWSEDKWIESLIQTFEDGYFEGFNQLKSYGVIDWLKSLKERIE